MMTTRQHPRSIRTNANPRVPTVLIVDDDDTIRELLRAALEADGLQVLTAADGAAAWSVIQLARCRVDLVLTDVMMPRMNGLALGKRLRLACPDLPVIFMSGLGRDHLQQDLLPDDLLLRKPFDLERILATIKEQLAAVDGRAGRSRFLSA